MRKLVLEMPPSINNYWKPAGNRMVLTQVARDYKQYIWAALQDYKDLRDDKSLFAIDLDLYMKRQSGDTDNRNKPLFDALQGFVYKNDKQICDFSVRRYYDPDNPRVEVFLYKVKGPRPRK